MVDPLSSPFEGLRLAPAVEAAEPVPSSSASPTRAAVAQPVVNRLLNSPFIADSPAADLARTVRAPDPDAGQGPDVLAANVPAANVQAAPPSQTTAVLRDVADVSTAVDSFAPAAGNLVLRPEGRVEPSADAPSRDRPESNLSNAPVIGRAASARAAAVEVAALQSSRETTRAEARIAEARYADRAERAQRLAADGPAVAQFADLEARSDRDSTAAIADRVAVVSRDLRDSGRVDQPLLDARRSDVLDDAAVRGPKDAVRDAVGDAVDRPFAAPLPRTIIEPAAIVPSERTTVEARPAQAPLAAASRDQADAKTAPDPASAVPAGIDAVAGLRGSSGNTALDRGAVFTPGSGRFNDFIATFFPASADPVESDLIRGGAEGLVHGFPGSVTQAEADAALAAGRGAGDGRRDIAPEPRESTNLEPASAPPAGSAGVPLIASDDADVVQRETAIARDDAQTRADERAPSAADGRIAVTFLREATPAAQGAGAADSDLEALVLAAAAARSHTGRDQIFVTPRFQGGPENAIQAEADPAETIFDLQGEGNLAAQLFAGSVQRPALVSGAGIAGNSPFAVTANDPLEAVARADIVESSLENRQIGVDPGPVPPVGTVVDFQPEADPQEALDNPLALTVDPLERLVSGLDLAPGAGAQAIITESNVAVIARPDGALADPRDVGRAFVPNAEFALPSAVADDGRLAENAARNFAGAAALSGDVQARALPALHSGEGHLAADSPANAVTGTVTVEANLFSDAARAVEFAASGNRPLSILAATLTGALPGGGDDPLVLAFDPAGPVPHNLRADAALDTLPGPQAILAVPTVQQDIDVQLAADSARVALAHDAAFAASGVVASGNPIATLIGPDAEIVVIDGQRTSLVQPPYEGPPTPLNGATTSQFQALEDNLRTLDFAGVVRGAAVNDFV